ncbi:thioredoxin fold domain containing protein [Pseudohyphozyma bogoriensis]|nr:thioredoxin fold domain containing protein [Pseudohyphozyma bogoriensis]
MSNMSPIILYDLVTSIGGHFCSPVAMKTRLALLNKGVPFEVKELTYGTIRSEWNGLDKPLKVEKATVPFIQKPDGSYLMDSVSIIHWLDATYPDEPNSFLPEAPLPVDVTTVEYKEASEKAVNFLRTLPNRNIMAVIYAPKIVNILDEGDREYFSSAERWGPGVWDAIVAKSQDRDTIVQQLKEQSQILEEALGDGLYFASKTAPGYVDFTLMGKALSLFEDRKPC